MVWAMAAQRPGHEAVGDWVSLEMKQVLGHHTTFLIGEMSLVQVGEEGAFRSPPLYYS